MKLDRVIKAYNSFMIALSERGYELISEYEGTGNKVILIHTSCGNEWKIAPSVFMKGICCPVCSHRNKIQNRIKNNANEFEDYVSNIGWSLQSEYESANTKIKLLHSVCGEVWDITPKRFRKKSHGCPNCRKNDRRKIAEEKKAEKERQIKPKPKPRKKSVLFQKRISESMIEDGYTLVGEYVNSSLPIILKHDRCGENWTVYPSNFSRGMRCPVCTRKDAMKDFTEKKAESFHRKISELGYTVLGEYIDGKTKINVECCDCSYIWNTTPNNIIKGKICPKCNVVKQREKLISKNKDIFYSILPDRGFELLSEYKDVRHKVTLRHIECGHVWGITPDHVKRGIGCPNCCVCGFKSDKSGYLYLYRWSLNGDTFLKYGITNNLERRIIDQSKSTEYEPTEVLSILWETGQTAKDIECCIKRLFKRGGVIDRDIFSDGFSETIPDTKENINTILDIIKKAII